MLRREMPVFVVGLDAGFPLLRRHDLLLHAVAKPLLRRREMQRGIADPVLGRTADDPMHLGGRKIYDDDD